MRLYEIAEEYRKACEEIVDPETGEVLPADTDALDDIADKLEDKVSNIAKVRAEMKAEADALRAEEKRIADRRRSLERREASLSDYVLFCMEAAGVAKLKSPTHTVWLQTSISVEVEGDVPDDFCVVEKRPDKKAIRALLDSGEPVPWARLSQKRGVRFR